MAGLSLFGVVLLIQVFPSQTAEFQCGNRRFNSLVPNTWTCCAGKLYPQRHGLFLACCNNRCFNPNDQHCCGKEIYPRYNINTACCNGKSYQRGTHGCCNNEVINLKTDDCCRNKPYDMKTQICCNGIISKKVSSNNRCCGTESYNSEEHSCCAEKIVERVGGQHARCCATKSYDSRTNSCCMGKIIPSVKGKDKCCNGVMIDSKEDICCGGEVKTKLYDAQTACCRVGGKQMSELPKDVSENEIGAKLGGSHVTYDKSHSLCCSGALKFNVFGRDAACCGQNVYNTKTHMCCLDKVHRRLLGVPERCCNDKPFDRSRHLCCRGVLHDIAKSERSYKFCCHSEVYDRRQAHCDESKTVSIYQCKDTIYLYGRRGNKIPLRY